MEIESCFRRDWVKRRVEGWKGGRVDNSSEIKTITGGLAMKRTMHERLRRSLRICIMRIQTNSLQLLCVQGYQTYQKGVTFFREVEANVEGLRGSKGIPGS